MKSILLLTIGLFSFVAGIFAQDQFLSKEINYDLYEDAACKVFYQSSGFYEFDALINWDYESKTIEIFDRAQGIYWLKATWKTEVNPDDISGDENNRYIFDPAKNELGMKVLKVYVNDGGTFTYKIEAGKQKIDITGIQWDMDNDGIADGSDGSEEFTEGSENYEDTESIEGEVNGAPLYYLNLTNATDYVIYLTANVQNENGVWTLSEGWIKIEPGQSEMIGTTYSDHFYYYAYCKDSKGEFVIWEGSDQYHEISGSDGSYGFRHVGLSQGAMDDFGEVWIMDITLE